MNEDYRDSFSHYFSEAEMKLLFRDSTEDENKGADTPEPDSSVQEPEAVGAEISGEAAQSGSPNKAARVLIICACCVLLALAAAGFSLVKISSSTDPYNGNILENVSVAGVPVGGMTEKQAVSAVTSAIGDSYRQNDMVVLLPEKEFHFSPEETGASLDVKAAVKAAFNFGRSGDSAAQQADYQTSLADGYTVDLLPYLTLNQEAIRSVLDAYTESFAGFYVPSGFTVEGEVPALAEQEFDASAAGQTLVLNKGASGFRFQTDDIFQQILDAYCNHEFLVDFSGGANSADPEPLDLSKIYDQLYIAPVEPQLDKQTFAVTPGSYGYGFDLEAAELLLSKAGAGEDVRISLQGIAPALLGDQVYFQDVLGFAVTPHSDNEKRNNNLRLACASLDKIILQPGETFSYNETLGERTEERGYLPAPAYSGTRLIDSVGGGICQVSSTLYLASLFSEMEIVDRINHGYPVNYIPVGLDATVNWGTTDLKIKNGYSLPVQIRAEESDGYVKIWIMGTEVRDYTVRMEFRAGGNYARSSVCRYTQEGALISKSDERFSAYLSDNLSAYGEIGSGQIYVNGNVKMPEFTTGSVRPEN